MDHIRSRPVGDSFAFGIADQRHALPLILRDINHALFARQISRNLCESVRLTRVTVVFRNGDVWGFFYWFRKGFFRKKSGGVICRKIMFGLGTEHLALEPRQFVTEFFNFLSLFPDDAFRLC